MDPEKSQEDLAMEKLNKARQVAEERNKSRVDMLNAIADNNDKNKDPGMKETDGDLVLEEPENKLESDADKAAKEAAEAEAAAKALQAEGVEEKANESEPEDSNEKEIDGVKHYKMVVNGKESWKTLEQIVASAQKVESADEYLAEAKSKATEKVEKNTDPEPKEEPVKVEPDDWEETLNAAVMGDKEAIKKVASALKRPSEMTPDVVKQIDDRWSFRTAAAWFEETYQDLLGDPRLKKLVFEEDAELAQTNPKMPYKQRLKIAGDNIRSAVAGWTKKPEKVEAKSSNDKLAAKRSLPSVPAAASRQPATQEEEPEESVEDAIAKMAKARGQARPIVHRPTNR